MKLKIKQFIFVILLIPTSLYNRFILFYKKVNYKSYPIINGKIFISGNGTIEIGENVRINSSLQSNPIGGDSRTLVVVYQDAKLTIGDNTGLSNVAISCKNNIKIGDNVKIGGGVKIYDSDFHSLNYLDRRISAKDIPITKPVIIEDDCFIGAQSIILKGVIIGKNSIVGAGSVVSKSIPENEIWGGNPIKFIKKVK